MFSSMINFEDIKNAREKIADHIFETPVLSNRSINNLVNANLFFKCENFQKTGSFKIRGASNAVFSFPEADLKKGIITGTYISSMPYDVGIFELDKK